MVLWRELAWWVSWGGSCVMQYELLLHKGSQRSYCSEMCGMAWEGRSLEVLGGELVAEEAGGGAHGLLDDPGALGDAGDELEGVVAPRLRIPAVPARQKSAVASAALRSSLQGSSTLSIEIPPLCSNVTFSPSILCCHRIGSRVWCAEPEYEKEGVFGKSKMGSPGEGEVKGGVEVVGLAAVAPLVQAVRQAGQPRRRRYRLVPAALPATSALLLQCMHF